MATTTPNYGWSVPTSSDLVKNGATDIETLGDSVDASLWNSGYGQAGKNKIINGDFSNWQRSTSAAVASEGYFAPDRFRSTLVTGGATFNWSRQTFTAGTAPVAGYEGQYFSRFAATSGSGTTVMGINQRIENVQTFAGQTATISFWAKADSARTLTVMLQQNFGSGGSATVTVSTQTTAITTSWARYSFTATYPSIAGKTIGTSSFASVFIYYAAGQASGSAELDVWGVQLEYGAKATPFQTASGGSIAGELAMCRRYLPAITALGSGSAAASLNGYAYGTNIALYNYYFDTPARVAPTGITLVGNWVGYALNTSYAVTPTFSAGSLNTAQVLASSGMTITAGQGSRLENSSAGASILFTGCEL